MAVNALKGGVIAVATTAAVEWAINQIPGANLDPLTGQPLITPEFQPSGTSWQLNHWSGPLAGYFPTFEAGCDAIKPVIPGGTTRIYDKQEYSNICRLRDNFSGYIVDTFAVGYLVTLNCPHGFNSSTGICNPVPAPKTPFSDTDWNALNGLLASMSNNDWLQGLINASCNGSLNPDGCYDSLVNNPFVIGPASQTGTPTSTTTTTTNPNGTTSSSTVTSTPSYSYTYGSNYYDFTTTNTTTTNNNGQVTTTVTTDTSEGTPAEDPASDEETEEETDFSGEYTDAPFSEVTPFYEQKYPDGLQGVWDSASAQVSSSAFLQFLQSFVPSFSGSCPSWSLSFNIMPQAMFGTFEFMSLCYVFDFVKIILMATAVFCARWIMFGG